MIISSAHLFGKQITAGEVPGLNVVWFNSKNASPMQSFGNNSNPYIKRNTTGLYMATWVGRNSANYPEPAAGFIGCDATPVQFTDLPWALYVPLLDSNEQESDYAMRYRAEVSSENTISVYCECGFMSGGNFTPVYSVANGNVTRYSNDQSCTWYLFTGAGAMLGNRAGSTLITDVTYTGVIAAGVDSNGTRFVDVNGSAADLTKIRNEKGVHLPYDRLSN